MDRPRGSTEHSEERVNRRVYSLGEGAGPGDIPGKAWGVPDVDVREAEGFLARKARVKRAESGECRIVLRRSPGVRVYAAATAAVDTFLLLALFFPAAADAVKAAASAAADRTFLILPYLFLALYVFNPVAYLWSLNALRHRTVLSRSGIEVRTLVRKERLPWPATRSGFGVLEHVAKRTSGASSHGYQLVLVKGTSDDVVRLPGGRFDTEKGSPHERAGRAEAATRQTGGAKRPVSDATTRADGAAWQADGAETRADDAATRLADTDNPKIQARLALEGIWSVASRHGWIPNRGSAKADPALIRARTGQGAHRENANRENAHRTNRENSARGFQGRSANRRGRASERGGRAGNRADGRADRLVFGGPDFRRAIEAARDDGASLTWVAAVPISVGALGLWLTLGAARRRPRPRPSASRSGCGALPTASSEKAAATRPCETRTGKPNAKSPPCARARGDFAGTEAGVQRHGCLFRLDGRRPADPLPPPVGRCMLPLCGARRLTALPAAPRLPARCDYCRSAADTPLLFCYCCTAARRSRFAATIW